MNYIIIFRPHTSDDSTYANLLCRCEVRLRTSANKPDLINVTILWIMNTKVVNCIGMMVVGRYLQSIYDCHSIQRTKKVLNLLLHHRNINILATDESESTRVNGHRTLLLLWMAQEFLCRNILFSLTWQTTLRQSSGDSLSLSSFTSVIHSATHPLSRSSHLDGFSISV